MLLVFELGACRSSSPNALAARTVDYRLKSALFLNAF
jgi:hypothetical protein